MALTVGAFLQEVAARPFRWGREGPDCVLMLCDWIALNRGVDPGEPYRSRYSTAFGAELVIRRAGGLTALLDAAFATAGVSRAEAAREGDVGLVRGLTERGEGLCGAIRFGDRWAGLSADGGLLVGPAEPVAVWRV